MSQDNNEQEKAAERKMLSDARDFLASPLASGMVMSQANIDRIVETMKFHGLRLDYDGFECGFVLCREKGLLDMKPAPVDHAALAAVEAERKRVAALEAQVKAAEEAKAKTERAVQKRIEYAARDREEGSHAVNRQEENQSLANARIYREGLERSAAEIKAEQKKLNAKSANDPNDFSSLPSISEIVAEGEISIERFKELSLKQAKEYRKRLFVAQEKIAAEKRAGK